MSFHASQRSRSAIVLIPSLLCPAAREHEVERRIKRIARPRNEVVDFAGLRAIKFFAGVEAAFVPEVVEAFGIHADGAARRAEEE